MLVKRGKQQAFTRLRLLPLNSSVGPRKQEMIYKLLILTFIIWSFLSSSADSCTCVLPDPEKTEDQLIAEAFKRSTAVFEGKVKSIYDYYTNDRRNSERRVTFTVITAWKGLSSKEVVIVTGFGRGDCGYEFEVGKNYLVYAGGSSQALGTSICHRTSSISYAQRDIRVISKLPKPDKNKTINICLIRAAQQVTAADNACASARACRLHSSEFACGRKNSNPLEW